MPRDLPPPHPPELVARVVAVILASPYRTVHYTGGADEGLLRALLADRRRIELSVMDMPDRWFAGARFFWDSEDYGGAEYPECPDWLEDVPFAQEGAPDHDIGIRDWPWYGPTEFGDLVAFGHRQPPRLVVLFGRANLVRTCTVEALEEAPGRRVEEDVLEPISISQPAYEWEQSGELLVGRWKQHGAPEHEKQVGRGSARADTSAGEGGAEPPTSENSPSSLPF